MSCVLFLEHFTTSPVPTHLKLVAGNRFKRNRFHEETEAQCTCGSQRMSFRDETTAGVDHELASVRVVPSVNQLSCFTCRGCDTHNEIAKLFRVKITGKKKNVNIIPSVHAWCSLSSQRISNKHSFDYIQCLVTYQKLFRTKKIK